MDHLQKELKKEFQLERMILFSDAVFAIAITLLIIEIKVPHLEHVTNQTLGVEIIHLIPKFVGFIVSFFVIGVYWVVHHRIFGYVVDYNPTLLRLNLFFLFSIVLMPFSSALYSEFTQPHLVLPMVWYVANICLTGFLNFMLMRYVANPKHKLGVGLEDRKQLRYFYSRSLGVPFMFVLALLVSLVFNHFIGMMVPALIPVYLWVVKKIFGVEKQ